jgi:hypothetical protein
MSQVWLKSGEIRAAEWRILPQGVANRLPTASSLSEFFKDYNGLLLRYEYWRLLLLCHSLIDGTWVSSDHKLGSLYLGLLSLAGV